MSVIDNIRVVVIPFESAVTAIGRFFWLIGLSFLRHLVNAVFGWLIRLIICAYLAER